MVVAVCLSVYAHTYKHSHTPEKGVRSPRAGVTGDQVLPHMGARTVLWLSDRSHGEKFVFVFVLKENID